MKWEKILRTEEIHEEVKNHCFEFDKIMRELFCHSHITKCI